MNLSRFVFKSHKWLAVATGLLTLMWFVSGIVMLVPVRFFGGPGFKSTEGPPGPDYRQVALSVPQAIATVETELGRTVKVTGMEFRRLAGRLFYRVQTDGAGSHLVDAVTGERYVIDEAAARELLRLVEPEAHVAAVTLVKDFDSDYTYGPLPAYRLVLADGSRTAYYISTDTGEIRGTNREGRWRSFIAGTHTFDFLRPVMTSAAHRLLLIGTSAIGTLMTVFGLAILWIQYVNWRARRRAH